MQRRRDAMKIQLLTGLLSVSLILMTASVFAKDGGKAASVPRLEKAAVCRRLLLVHGAGV